MPLGASVEFRRWMRRARMARLYRRPPKWLSFDFDGACDAGGGGFHAVAHGQFSSAVGEYLFVDSGHFVVSRF